MIDYLESNHDFSLYRKDLKDKINSQSVMRKSFIELFTSLLK